MTGIEIQLGSERYQLGSVIWDYLRVSHEKPTYTPGSPADILIMVLGSPDYSAAARHAASLLKEDKAEIAVVSGGCHMTGFPPQSVEADVIAELIEAQGVENKRLVRERLSQNTSEHFFRTKALLADMPWVAGGENPPKFVILVTAPVAERRALATARHRWRDTQFWVDGVRESYDQYMSRMDMFAALNRMVGEIDRIMKYPAFDYMDFPDETVTPEVEAAFTRLKKDFNSRLAAASVSERSPLPA